MRRQVAATLTVFAMLLTAYAVYSFSQVGPTVCSSVGRVIDVEQESTAVSRDAKLRERYYLAHPVEADRFRVRQNERIAELDGARC